MFIHNKKKKYILYLVNILIEVVSFPVRLFQKKIDPNHIQPARILLIRLDHIGDVVMTSPSYTLMRERFPDAKIYLLTNGAGRELYKEDPRIDEVLVFNWPWAQQRFREKFSWAKISELWEIISKIRREKIDIVVEFRGDLRFIFLFGVLTGARFRISSSRSGKSSLLHQISDYDVSKHEVERSLDVVSCFGKLEGQIRPGVYLNETDIAEAKNLISYVINAPIPHKLAVVAPYSSRDIKSWPAPYFLEAIKFLKQNDFTVIIVGTANDREHASDMIRHFDQGVYSFAGATSVRQLAALVSLSSLVVGVDTGVLHLASCFEVPIVAIFGSTRAIEFRPYSPHAKVVESTTCTCNQFLHVACDRQIEGYAHCMADIKPSAAIRAIHYVISGIDNAVVKEPVA